MPTPFSHLAVAQRLLEDDQIPASYRNLLHQEQGAFLLGNVAADARIGASLPREKTHFYAYERGIIETPWRVMLRENPSLAAPLDDAQRVFVAGYVAHLCMDEVWSKEMVGPHFVKRDWGDRAFRFYMLHIILIYMDERDFAQIEDWQADSLCSAHPQDWLPFMSDHDLRTWQDLIYEQIKPGGRSETLEIFGERISKTPAEMRDFLDSQVQMFDGLWAHISPGLLADIEAQMYEHARQQMCLYLAGM
jgi:hypothetical protein